MSTRPSVSLRPAACSGAMYSGVPNTEPARVSRGPSFGLAPCEGRDLRDAEVDDLHEVGAAVAVDEEDVLGLEIAVDDALVVGRAQRLRDLRGDLDQRAIGRQRRRQLDRLATASAR
jgi:hypothetical protein